MDKYVNAIKLIQNSESEDIPIEESVITYALSKEEYSRKDLYKKFREEFTIQNYNKNIIEEWFVKINYMPENNE